MLARAHLSKNNIAAVASCSMPQGSLSAQVLTLQCRDTTCFTFGNIDEAS